MVRRISHIIFEKIGTILKNDFFAPKRSIFAKKTIFSAEFFVGSQEKFADAILASSGTLNSIFGQI